MDGSPGQKRAILWLAAAAVAAALGAFLLFVTQPFKGPSITESPERAALTRLYFADPLDACLRVEERPVTPGDGPAATGKALVAALIDGPTQDLARTLPPGAAVTDVFIRNGIAYVNLSAGAVSGHPGGSEAELLTVYSIVNTLCFNLSGVEAVKILIEGESVTTFKGHMDLRC
jgi:hypothetical protein